LRGETSSAFGHLRILDFPLNQADCLGSLKQQLDVAVGEWGDRG
jgi:hypothetical protein